jgi:hypothetical protein
MNLKRKDSFVMKYIFRNLSFLMVVLFAYQAQAAIPAKQASAIPSKILSGSGATFGGVAGKGFTLLDMRRTADRKRKIERLVFDVGDRDGKVLKGWPGYFHSELKKNPQRLVLDFAQMPQANIDQAGLIAKLKGSGAVRNIAMSLEPVDQTLNLTMDLKKNTKVKMYQVRGQNATSKVVVDLMIE